MKPQITIIILNWNGWKDTVDCLESLYQIIYPNYNVIVVDNNSEDDSIEKIKIYCDGELKVESELFAYKYENKPIKLFECSKNEIEDPNVIIEFKNVSSDRKLMLIKNDANYGFAEGNNIGMRYALKNLNPDHILLLNNDTIVDKEFLNEMINAVKEKPRIGFVGPKIYYYDYNGRRDVINFAGGCLNLLKGSTRHIGINEIDEGQYDQTKTVDYVEGSCLLIRKKVLEEVGLLDTTYFAYWEENDLCMRGLKQNYGSLYVHKAKIWHKISCSSKGATKIYYLTRNRFWFVRKYTNIFQYALLIIYFFLFEFWFKIIVYTFYKRNPYLIKYFLKGIKDGF